MPGTEEPVTTPGRAIGLSEGEGALRGGALHEQQGASAQASALAGELSDRVVDVVAWVRARTTVRVVTLMRALVYGSIALVALVAAAVLATTGVVRVWDAYVPVYPLGTRVWLGYVVFGGVLFVCGAWLLAPRRARH